MRIMPSFSLSSCGGKGKRKRLPHRFAPRNDGRKAFRDNSIARLRCCKMPFCRYKERKYGEISIIRSGRGSARENAYTVVFVVLCFFRYCKGVKEVASLNL